MGGRAGKARGDTYTRGGRGGGRAPRETPPPGDPTGEGLAEASGARRTPAPGRRARRGGSRRARRAREERSRRGADPQLPARERQAAREGLRAGVCNAVGSSAVGGAPEGCIRSAASSRPGGRVRTGRSRASRASSAGAAAEAGRMRPPARRLRFAGTLLGRWLKVLDMGCAGWQGGAGRGGG